MSVPLPALTPPSSAVWLEQLRKLYPVRGLTHVGAGQGEAIALYERWGLDRVVLIEADPVLGADLRKQARAHENWTVHAVLVSERDGPCNFHVASNPDESGTVAPAGLRAVWRNLQLVETRRFDAVRLDSLLVTQAPDGPNWLVVDCVPALPVLQGAASALDLADVLVLRVGMVDALPADSGIREAEVTAWLGPLAFDRLVVEEERNRAFGRAIYVRRWKHKALRHLRELEEAVGALGERTQLAASRLSELESLRVALNAAELAAQHNKARIEQLSQAHNEQSRLAAERGDLLEQTTRLLEVQTQRAQGHWTEVEALRAAQDASEQAEDEYQARIAELGQAHGEQAQLAMERQTELEALRALQSTTQEAAGLAAQGSEARIRQLIQAHSELAGLAAERAVLLDRAERVAEAMAQLAQERQDELEGLRAARDAAAYAASEYEARIEELGRTHDEQARLAAEREVLHEQATAMAHGQAQLSQERLAELEGMREALRIAQETTKEGLARIQYLSQAHEEQAHLAVERAGLLDQALRTAETQTQLAQASQSELDSMREALRASQETFERVTQEREAANQNAQQQQANAEGLESTVAGQLEAIRQYRQQLETQQAASVAAEEKARQLMREAAEARTSLTLSLRSQNLASADLRDLQAQYAALVAKYKERLLLEESVKDRLMVAVLECAPMSSSDFPRQSEQ